MKQVQRKYEESMKNNEKYKAHMKTRIETHAWNENKYERTYEKEYEERMKDVWRKYGTNMNKVRSGLSSRIISFLGLSNGRTEII